MLLITLAAMLAGLWPNGPAVSASASELSPPAVCFTTGNGSAPGSDCAAFAVDEIDQAHSVLLVQAYYLTEIHIIAAIGRAAMRGVKVTVLVDKAMARERYVETLDELKQAGAKVLIDRRPTIAHNKVMVIDGQTVLTGSFNWTAAAENRNAENLIVLRSVDLAQIYAANFAARQAVSEAR